MAVIPVWTSTKNTEDRESENAFIEENKDLKRISNAQLDSLDPSEMNLKKFFGAQIQVQLQKDWIEKLLPKATDWSMASLDLSLRHVQISLSGMSLSISSASRDRIITLKSDVEMSESGQTDELRDFSICVSTEQIASMLKFLQKTFGTGNCDIGVKINDSGACDYLLVCCYGLAPTEEKDTVMLKRDELGNPVEGPPSIKAALFKLQRSIGSLPIPTAYPNWEVKYKAALKPALRWVFSNKQEYVELITDGGMLKAKFCDEANRVVEASLGAQVSCNIPLPEDDTPVAYIKGAYFRDIFNYVKEPVTLTFGFEKIGEKYAPTPIYVESQEICAIIAQSYPEDAMGKVEAYITHKKGKVVETDKEDAEKRAQKQNKGADAIIEFGEEILQTNDPTETSTEQSAEPPVEDGTVPIVNIDPMPVIGIDAKTTEELLQSLQLKDPKVDTPELVLNEQQVAMRDNLVSSLSMVMRQINNITRDTAKTLELAINLFGTPDDRREFKKEVDAQKDPETKRYVYDIDAIANYFIERPGKEIHITAIRDTLPHLKVSTVNTTVLKLVDETVIERVRKGIYRAPEDVSARFEVFRSKYPARRKKL